MFLGVLALFTLQFSSCKNEDGNGGSDEEYNRKEMLTNVGENIISINYYQLNASVNQLQNALALFVSAPSVQELEEVRNQLKLSRITYQKCTPFEFGPASDVSLRSTINTYPLNQSQVESNILNGGYDLSTAANLAAKGFPAIEYLIFLPGLTDAEIVDEYKLGSSANARKQYLQDVVVQIGTEVSWVNQQWNQDGYLNTFIQSDGKAVGSSVSLWINALVLDFERFIRDGKIGIPLGVRSLGVPQEDKTEAYYSGYSVELTRESILGFQQAFNGTRSNGENGQGLDDYLKFEGGEQISIQINDQLDKVLIELNDLNDPLSSDIISNKKEVEEVYEEMQKTIVLLKVNMPSILSVLITYQDSDGD